MPNNHHEPAPKTTIEHAADTPVSFAHELEAEPLKFTYDPSNLGTITAEELDGVYDDVSTDIANGMTPEEVQASVYDKLASKGFDLESVQGNRLVVRFEGVDGKSDVRAINIDYEDFGTRDPSVVLEEIVAEAEDDTKADLDKQATHELAGQLSANMDNLIAVLESDQSDADGYKKRSMQLINAVSELEMQMRRGGPVGRDKIVGLINGSSSLIAMSESKIAAADQERTHTIRQINGIHETVSRKSEPVGDGTRQLLAKADSMYQSMAQAMSSRYGGLSGLGHNLQVINRVLEDAAKSNNYGYEDLSRRLRRAIDEAKASGSNGVNHNRHALQIAQEFISYLRSISADR